MNTEAEVLAWQAISQAKRNASAIMQAVPSAPPGLEADVERAVERAVYQDAPLRSWRVWGSVWSGLTAVLLIPEVQTAIQAVIGATLPPVYVPLATAVLGAVWPAISKARDPRPTRVAAP